MPTCGSPSIKPISRLREGQRQRGTRRLALPFSTDGAQAHLSVIAPESKHEELIMKTIASALLALSILAGFAATASAAPYAESIWPYLDRDNRGGQSQ